MSPRQPYQRTILDAIRTLRFRLTFWNTLVVLLLVIATLVGVREGLRLSLLHEADTELQEDTVEIRLTILDLYPDMEQIQNELDRKADSHTHRGLYIRIFDEQQRLVWSSHRAPHIVYSNTLLKSGSRPVTAGVHRMIHARLKDPVLPRWTIRVASSYAPLEAVVSQLTRLIVTVGTIALVISPLGGYWLAGRATRPLAHIIDTTDRLQPENLEERLPRRGTGDELDRLSSTINGFLDRIAAYLARNREFTANAAHELRSPLTAIQSSIEVALNTDRSIDEYKEMLADILDECADLRVLVNQLLILAESDAGRRNTNMETLDLSQIVGRAREMFEGVAESRGVQLVYKKSDTSPIVGDRGRLRQVVNNLIDNALKFSDAKQEITVALQNSPDNKEVVLTVLDHGTGIPPEDLPHIFERFYRGDRARQRERGLRGSGLGLSICQSIVQAHGGDISFQSTLGAGTLVVVRIPAVQETIGPAAIAVSQEASQA